MQLLTRLRERYRLSDSLLENLISQSSAESLQFLNRTEGSIESLLLETYAGAGSLNVLEKLLLAGYYRIRPLLSDRTRASLQRQYFNRRVASFPAWPIDMTADRLLEQQLAHLMRESGVESVPFIWFWPNDSMACAIVTHDVETERGLRLCEDLIQVDGTFGILGSIQIVPEERYHASPALLENIRNHGWEIAVHDLNHDGRLFLNRTNFAKRSGKVNQYAKEFQSPGFRAGAMYRNQQWLRELDFEFDMSVPNTARFEPQRGGCCTVMPYFIGRMLEFPLTTAQDYTLFHILKTYSVEVWFQQVNAILQRNGLISILTHPDYIMEEKALAIYRRLLERIAALAEKQRVWTPKPGELNQWWRERASLKLEEQDGQWRIVGEGAARARVAYAVLSGDSVSYQFNGREVHPAELC